MYIINVKPQISKFQDDEILPNGPLNQRLMAALLMSVC
jgi:hypothetical protein